MRLEVTLLNIDTSGEIILETIPERLVGYPSVLRVQAHFSTVLNLRSSVLPYPAGAVLLEM